MKKKKKSIIKNVFMNYFNSTNKWITIIMVILIFWSVLNIVTASTTSSVDRYNYNLFNYFFYHSFMIGVGLLGYFLSSLFPTKLYYKFAKILFAIIFLLIIALFFFAESHKGALAWLPIPFTSQSIQPSEFYKVVLIVGIAIVFDKHRKELQNLSINKSGEGLMPIAKLIALGIVVPLIVMLQKDFGTAIIMIGIFGVMIFASEFTSKIKIKLMQAGVIIVIFISLITIFSPRKIFTDVQFSRINFLNPCSRYETGGYQTCNTLIAINNGGLFGLGIGKSQQKYSYVPEAHTDSVFAILIEETGLVGATIVFGLYFGLLSTIYKISQNSKTVRGKMITLGVAAYIFLHIFINLGGLLAIIPLTGLPLPFFTYGGSYTISLLTSLGLVQRVYIENK
jgi:cell division protein FtsW